MYTCICIIYHMHVLMFSFSHVLIGAGQGVAQRLSTGGRYCPHTT